MGKNKNKGQKQQVVESTEKPNVEEKKVENPKIELDKKLADTKEPQRKGMFDKYMSDLSHLKHFNPKRSILDEMKEKEKKQKEAKKAADPNYDLAKEDKKKLAELEKEISLI